jgi:hypothetical protein
MADHNYDYLLEDYEPPKYRINRRKPSPIRRFLLMLIKVLVTIAFLVVKFGGIAIYLWTILIAFHWSGFLSAFLTFILPVVGQLFWAWKIISTTGVFWNLYTIALVAYIGTWIMIFACSTAMAILED